MTWTFRAASNCDKGDMPDSYLQIAIVTIISLFGWLINSLLQAIKMDIHKLGETMSAITRDLRDARKEFEGKVTNQGFSLRAEIADLSRRLASVEGHCQSEHGEHMRRADDIHRMTRS